MSMLLDLINLTLRRHKPSERFLVQTYDEEYGLFYASDAKGQEHYLGACFAGQPLLGADASTVERLRSALSNIWPAGTFIQLSLMSMPDVDQSIDYYHDSKIRAIIGSQALYPEQKTLLAEFVRRRRDFISNGQNEPLIKSSGALLNRQELVVTVKVPCRANPSADDMAIVHDLTEKLLEGLKACGIRASKQDAGGYLRILRRMTHVYGRNDNDYEDSRLINEQACGPGDIVDGEHMDHLVFNGNEYSAKLLSVKRYPKRASLAIMNYIVGDPNGLSNQVTDPYILTLTLHYPDQIKKAGEVQRKFQAINYQVFGPMAKIVPILGYKKAGFDTLIHEMEGKGAVLVEANLTMTLFSKDLPRLKRLASNLQTYYASLGFEMQEDKVILAPLFFSTLPLNASVESIKGLNRYHTMAVSHAVQFMPVIGEWTATGPGGASLLITRHCQAALIDLYDSDTNYNGVLLAESGAGKSFLTQLLIADYLARDSKIWVIDVGRSYLKQAKAFKGEFIEFSETSRICLNPFTLVQDIDEEADFLKTLLAKMAAPEDGLDDFGMAVMEEAIKSVWGHYGTKMTVTEVADWLGNQNDPRMRDMARQLYPFTRHGSHGHWFDGENNLDFNNSFVVLELEELKSKKVLQQVVLLQLIAKVNHEMFLTRGRNKILIIDEAWDLMDDPGMAKALETAYRRVRKYSGSVLVISQSIADMYNSSNAKAIYQNSAYQLIMQQKAESIDDAIKQGQFKIDGYGASQLKTVHTVPGKYSEIMIKRGESDWGIVRLVGDRFTQVLFSTKGDERDVIINDIERGEDVVQSINRFIEVNG